MSETQSTLLLTRKFCPRCGGQFPAEAMRCDEDDAPLLPVGSGKDRAGSVMRDKYVLVRLLGEGSFGQVYQATHRLAKADMALKLLREERRDDPSARKQFVKEARAVMRLHTRHACVIHDVDEDADGTLFLVMELLRGINLDAYRQKAAGGRMRLPWQVAVRFARQICEALEEAHDAGVVHRDLKPANVMIERARDGAEYAKVVDFGIARLASQADQEAATTETAGKIIGTPAYMSPEQCRGGTVDGRTDLYALGCILYELLTGERPFKSGTSQGMIVAHVVETPVPPSRAFPDLEVPPDLERIVMALLEKDARKRPQTAAEVKAWLEALSSRDAAPAVARVGGGGGLSRKWLWIGGAALLAGLAAGAVAALLAGGGADAPTEAATVAGAPTVETVPVAQTPSEAVPAPGAAAIEVQAQPAPGDEDRAQAQEPAQGQEVATTARRMAPAAIEVQAQPGEAPAAAATALAGVPDDSAADLDDDPEPAPQATPGKAVESPTKAASARTAAPRKSGTAATAASAAAPDAPQPVQAAPERTAPTPADSGTATARPAATAPAGASPSGGGAASSSSSTSGTSSSSLPALPRVPDPSRLAPKSSDPAGDPVRDKARGAFDSLHRRTGDQ